jgi:DNA topoisomerase I
MSKNLVIVESPAKSKTIEKFLGKDYKVLASMGHVRDLPKSKMGIEIDNNFEPSYLIPVDKKKTITQLKKHIKSDTVIWLATDHDREGEAIAWHLVEALKIKKNPLKRILFHEITKTAIQEAIASPGEMNMDLVNAQQARRVLDRLVGYELSPLLWKKIRYGLSAGRVQSVAVRLIVDRERERNAFKPEEYWSITAEFYSGKDKKRLFTAKLNKKDGSPLKIGSEKEANKILKDLEKSEYTVTSVEEKEVKRNPAPPFITSTLQQEAARKLRMSVKKTMVVAQQLYEGITTGDGHHGLITYMRTDSLNLSTLATTAMRKLISSDFGKEYALDKPRVYKKKKGAQEAHEAIRPVDVTLRPDDVKEYLDKDQFRLYELIWKRAMASQMAAAIMERVVVDVGDGEHGYEFRANGQRVKFPGFIKVYVEDVDDPEDAEDNEENMLPLLKVKQVVYEKELVPAQHFTKPPARYTEASLVKKLESEGIGRPSTYAPTISTIMTRGYVEKEEGTLAPTDTADVVVDMLVEHFPSIVDIGFTAGMENDLDKIAEGEEDWHKFLANFYEPFHKNIEEKMESIKKEDVVNQETDEKCDLCKKPMVIKLGRFGKFYSCSDYPTCKHAKPLKEDPEAKKEMEDLQKKLGGKKCSKCSSPMEVKRGRYGEFLGCTGYPKCRNMESIIKFSGVHCPECKDGQLIERRTKKGGRLFWGCNKFPKCKFASWDKPLEGACKKCGGLRVLKKEEEICVTCKD